MLYLVMESGHLEHLTNVTMEQAAIFIDMYPTTHIFEGDSNAD